FGSLKTQQALQTYHQKGYVQFIEEKEIPIHEFIERRDHLKIVETYNLSRRITGNIYHSMIEEIKDQHPDEREPYRFISSHKDYTLYQEWRDIKIICTNYMKQNLKECKAYMKELGVD